MSNLAITATLAYSRAKGNARLLQLVIADAINRDTDRATRKVANLAFDCNLGHRNIQLNLLKQIAAGELIGFQDAHAGGRWYTFAIPIYPGEEGHDPVPCAAEDHYCNGRHTPLEVSRHMLYDQKALAARKRDQQTPVQRRRTVIPPVDNTDSYPQPAIPGSHDHAITGSHTAIPGSHDAITGSHTAISGSFPPHPPISRPISYPSSTQVDRGASPAKKTLSRAEAESRRQEARRREDERLYGRRAAAPEGGAQ